MKALDFLLLEHFKANDQVLTVDEVFNAQVNEDLMFNEFDKAGHLCPLSLPMSHPRPDLVVVVPQSLPELKVHAPSNLPPTKDIV